MTREIVSVTVDSSLAEVVALMEGRRIKRLLDLERSYESLSSIGYLPYAAANTEPLFAMLQCSRTHCSRLRAPSQLALRVVDVPEAFQAPPDVLRRKRDGLEQSELALGAVAAACCQCDVRIPAQPARRAFIPARLRLRCVRARIRSVLRNLSGEALSLVRDYCESQSRLLDNEI